MDKQIERKPSRGPGSQCAMILNALRQGESITALSALERFGCFRLAARINDLRNDGHAIEATSKDGPNGKRFSVYKLKM